MQHSSSNSVHKHGSTSSRGLCSKRKAQRVQRACSNCRKRKQGCEEERPCKRCVEKGIECVEVEGKRKRGRVRGQIPIQRARSDSRSGDEMLDYSIEEDDDVEEDFCESDQEEILSDDEHNTRGRSSSSLNSSTNSITTHVFRLNIDSNTSSSNLHSRIESDANLFSIVNSSSSSSSTASHDIARDRSSSVSSDAPPMIPDSPISTEPLDEYESAMEVSDGIYDGPYGQGLNLALLLPFIGNIENSSDWNDATPMFVDDDQYLLDDLTHSSTGNSTSTGDYHFNKSLSTPSSSIQDRVWSSDLPFFTTATPSHHPHVTVEESDTRAQAYIKECWEEFQIKSKNKLLDVDLQSVRDSWKEIIKCLRGLEWMKLPGLLKEMETLPMSDYLGGYMQPAMLYWTSGGRIHHANESFCKMVAYSEEELRLEVSLDMNLTPSAYYGHKMRAHSIFHPDETMKILKRQLEAIQHPDRSCYQLNTRLLSKFRHEIPVSCSILNIRDTVGFPLLTVAIFV